MKFKFRYKANKYTITRLAETFPRVKGGEIVYLYPLIDDGCRADFVYRKGIINATVTTDLIRKKAKKKVKSFLEKKHYVGDFKPDEATSHKSHFIIKESI